MDMQNIASWAPYLDNSRAIAAYIEETSPKEVDSELIEELFFDSHAVLQWVPISSITPGDPNSNIPNRRKQAKYDVMEVKSMPPLVIEAGVLQDGHHRLRSLQKRGITKVLCYVVIDGPIPQRKPDAKRMRMR